MRNHKQLEAFSESKMSTDIALVPQSQQNKTKQKNKKMDTAIEISQCEPFRAWREPGTKWQSATTWQCLPEREAKTKTPAAVSLTITQSDQTIENSYWAETNKQTHAQTNKHRHNLPKSETKLTWQNKHTDTHFYTHSTENKRYDPKAGETGRGRSGRVEKQQPQQQKSVG